MSQEELIHNCKQGNRTAQAQLYRQFSSVLFGICLKYSRNKTEAEDNLHDSFMTIYDKIGQYGAKGSFEGWIKRITVNTVMQKYRKQKHLSVVSENTENQIEVTTEQDNVDLQTLLAYIQQLPNKYRLTFNMYVLDGYSHQQIAQELGTSEGTSKSNLSRARVLLKEKIQADNNMPAIGVLFLVLGKSESNNNGSKKKISYFGAYKSRLTSKKFKTISKWVKRK